MCEKTQRRLKDFGTVHFNVFKSLMDRHTSVRHKKGLKRGGVNEKREKELELGHRIGMYSNKQARRVCEETKTMIHGTKRTHSLTDLRSYSC